jgi:hypothetical protein
MQPNVNFRCFEDAARPHRRAGRGQRLVRSAAIKAAIVEATLPDQADPVPDRDEVLTLLGEAARSGSVATMRELLAHHAEQRMVARPAPDPA